MLVILGIDPRNGVLAAAVTSAGIACGRLVTMISRRRFGRGILGGLGTALLGGVFGPWSGGTGSVSHPGGRHRERHHDIKVVGVGGAGVVAADVFLDSGPPGVQIIAVDTDGKRLLQSRVPTRVLLGRERCLGMNAMAIAEFGRQAAEDSAAEIADVLTGADMVFILAGLGGGTGTGGAPIVARAAREAGALTVGVVTRPFGFEGKWRRENAEQGIIYLGETIDTLCVIPMQYLLHMVGERSSMRDTFRAADDMSMHAVRGIVKLLSAEGSASVDFDDVRSVLGGQRLAKIGIGAASGRNKAVEATRRALACSTLGEDGITKVTGVLLNITANGGMNLSEVGEAAALVQEEAREGADIVFGWVIDDSMAEEFRVTVIASESPFPSAC
jgi:cell division protein FtsZ